MRLQLIGSLAAVLALTACESMDCNKNGADWNEAACCDDVPGSACDFKKSTNDTVLFPLNGHHLNAADQAIVKGQVEWLKKWPSANVVVEGHCDERGTVEYNLALGDRRAHSVSKALKAHGIDGSRIDTVSFGKERPAVEGSNEAAWSQNRRAVTVVR